MGGHAFENQLGPSAKFPRMDATTYNVLKEHVSSVLSTRFASVSIAREDPAKVDFGDLDVVILIDNAVEMDLTRDKMREELSSLVGAERALSNGRQFITLAVRSEILYGGDVGGHNAGDLAGLNRPSSQADEHEIVYHQVDVNLVRDEEERESLVFYNSYGDLGMILALLTKTIGLSYSRAGLKVSVLYMLWLIHALTGVQLAHPLYMERVENRPFYLTTSTKAVLAFLGLNFDMWGRGFETRKDIFDWILTSRFADRDRLLGISPKHLERPMYQDFLRYLEAYTPTPSSHGIFNPDSVVEEALEHFGKKEEYEEQAKTVYERKALKQALNGRIVEEVTGLHGSIVGKIIRKIKEMMPVEELLAKSKEDMGTAILDAVTLITSDVA
jgi:hypothetical protein